jgi:hypothetical protein
MPVSEPDADTADLGARALVSDILMLLTLSDPLAEFPTVTPRELVLPTPGGLLGLAAGPWPLAADAFVAAVFAGNDALRVFSAVAHASGDVEILRCEPGPWTESLFQLARHVRDNLGTIEPGWLAPGSAAVH